MPNYDHVTTLESDTHKVTKCSTHKDMWVFYNKLENTWYSINASISWIMNNFRTVKIHPETVKKRKFTRRSH